MANYHLHVKTVSRGKGHSAIAASAYRAGVSLYDERTGKQADYSNRHGVVHNEVMTPDNAPQWMNDRQALWNAVEAQEKRKDSQLAREVEFSLPRELSDEQNIVLARQFIQESFVDKGMVADFAFHKADASDGEGNPHIHCLLTMRHIDNEAFSKDKATEWNKKPVLEGWRKEWEQQANSALEAHGYDERIDHRSLVAQGIERTPQTHVGKDSTVAAKAEGYQERLARNEEIKERNRLVELAGKAKDNLVSGFHKAANWVRNEYNNLTHFQREELHASLEPQYQPHTTYEPDKEQGRDR